jgi:hypothetical protein
MTTLEYPLQGGDPDDFGIMQINNPRRFGSLCDNIIWNWTTNIDEGKQILRDDIAFIRDWYAPETPEEQKRTPLSEDQILKAAYCRYNLGNNYQDYWNWIGPNVDTGEDGYWDENPPPPQDNHIKSYPEEVWDIYTAPHPDWQ